MDSAHDTSRSNQQQATQNALPAASCSSKFSRDLEQIQRMQMELAEMTALLGMPAGPGSSSSSSMLDHHHQQQHQHVVEALASDGVADPTDLTTALIDVPSAGSAASVSTAAAAAAEGHTAQAQWAAAASMCRPHSDAVSPPPAAAPPPAALVHIKLDPDADLCAAAGSDLDPNDQSGVEVCHFVYDDHMTWQQPGNTWQQQEEQQREQQQQQSLAHMSGTWLRQNIVSAHIVQQQQQQQLQKVSHQQTNTGRLQQQQMMQILSHQQSDTGSFLQQQQHQQQSSYLPVQQDQQLLQPQPINPLSFPSWRSLPREHRTGPRRCSNCGIDSSNSKLYWRHDPANPSRELCNACGQYKAKYGRDRPGDDERGRWQHKFHSRCSKNDVRELEAIKAQMGAQNGNALPMPDLIQPPVGSTSSSTSSSSSSSEMILTNRSSRPSPEAAVSTPAAADIAIWDQSVTPPLLPPPPPPPAAAAAAASGPQAAALPPLPPSAAAAVDCASWAPPRKRPRRQQNEGRQCANCKIGESTNWRTDPADVTRKLCNACGLYKIKNRFDRPLELVAVREQVKKMGNRVASHGVMRALQAYAPIDCTRPYAAPSYMQTGSHVTAVPVVAVQPVAVQFVAAAPVQPRPQECVVFTERGPAEAAQVTAAAGTGTTDVSPAEVACRSVSPAIAEVPSVLGPAVAAAAAMRNAAGSLPQDPGPPPPPPPEAAAAVKTDVCVDLTETGPRGTADAFGSKRLVAPAGG